MAVNCSEGSVEMILSHGGRSLPGLAAGRLRRIIPKLHEEVAGIFQKHGSSWKYSKPIGGYKPMPRLPGARAIGGVITGAFFIDMFASSANVDNGRYICCKDINLAFPEMNGLPDDVIEEFIDAALRESGVDLSEYLQEGLFDIGGGFPFDPLFSDQGDPNRGGTTPMPDIVLSPYEF